MTKDERPCYIVVLLPVGPNRKGPLAVVKSGQGDVSLGYAEWKYNCISQRSCAGNLVMPHHGRLDLLTPKVSKVKVVSILT